MFFGKKLKAFSMVELMMVLLISALIIAAIVPIVTRKHMQLPTLAPHGAYLCYYGPRSFDASGNITDNTIVLREARWSGTDYSRLLFDRETSNCVFDPPKRAAFFQITAVGGGGGGSDSGYRPTMPTQHYDNDIPPFDPFKVSEDDLKALDVSVDTFNKYSGYVIAYAQAKDSGDGGDMDWYDLDYSLDKDKTCTKRVDKVVETTYGEPETIVVGKKLVEVKPGTPPVPGYYTHRSKNTEKKFVYVQGDPIYNSKYCCTYKGSHNPIPSWENNTDWTADKDASDCFSCKTGKDYCDGGKDMWVYINDAGSRDTSRGETEDKYNVSTLNGYVLSGHSLPPGVSNKIPIPSWVESPGSCQICKDADPVTYYMVCNKDENKGCYAVFQDYDPYPNYEDSPTYYTDGNARSCKPGDTVVLDRNSGTKKCPGAPKLCQSRTESDLKSFVQAAGISWYGNNDSYWSAGDGSGIHITSTKNCTFALNHYVKKYVWRVCWKAEWYQHAEIKPGVKTCKKVADPDDNTCSAFSGNYKDICYEYDASQPDGIKRDAAGNKIEISGGCVDASSRSYYWTWHPPVPGTDGEYRYEDITEVVTPEIKTLVCPKKANGDRDVDPSDSSLCRCTEWDPAVRTIKYVKGSPISGGSGASGAQCYTNAIKVGGKENMLKYWDGSNLGISGSLLDGDYTTPYSESVGVSEYFTARKHGASADAVTVPSDSVSELIPGYGWDADTHPGYYYANDGTHWCAKKTDPFTEAEVEGSKTCSAYDSSYDPTWSKVKIEKGNPTTATYTTKAYSARTAGTGASRYEYSSKKDRHGYTIYVTDADGNDVPVSDPVKQNKPGSSASSGTSGYCDPTVSNSLTYKLSDNVNRSISKNTIFSKANGKPYGYILIHDDGTTIEDAGKYKVGKTYDTNKLASGTPGTEGAAATIIVKNISSENRGITIGVGGSAAGLGTGGPGADGAPTTMGSLINVAGGLGGYGSQNHDYEYPEIIVYNAATGTFGAENYNAVQYEVEDACYFRRKFNDLPASETSYMGRTRSWLNAQLSGAGVADACNKYDSGVFTYKWHVQNGGAYGASPDFESAGGKPAFYVGDTSPIAQLAFDTAGTGGQGGGVEHFCFASQKVVVFDGKIDYETSVFKEHALIPGNKEYEIFFGDAAIGGNKASNATFPPPTTAEKNKAWSRRIPPKCYRDGGVLSYNHIAGSPGKDGILLIRW